MTAHAVKQDDPDKAVCGVRIGGVPGRTAATWPMDITCDACTLRVLRTMQTLDPSIGSATGNVPNIWPVGLGPPLPYLGCSEQPELVQRLYHQRGDPRRGSWPDTSCSVCSVWALGSEFADSWSNRAWLRMAHNAVNLTVCSHVFHGQKPLWAVASAEGQNVAARLIQREGCVGPDTVQNKAAVLLHDNWRLRAPTRMYDALGVDPLCPRDPTMAWLALDAAPEPFAIFQTEALAVEWRGALQRAAVTFNPSAWRLV